MYVGRDFDVSDQDEQEAYAFDFINDLADGDSIVTAVWTVATDEGVDPNPMARLVSTPWIVTPPVTVPVTPASVTAQILGTGVPGVNYIVRAVVQTTRGMTLSLFSHSRCEIIP